jgi:hypothetical protein
MGSTTTAVRAEPVTESILVTGNSSIENLQRALGSLDNIEGCLFGEHLNDSPPLVAREGVEARSAQTNDLAYQVAERLERIYARL